MGPKPLPSSLFSILLPHLLKVLALWAAAPMLHAQPGNHAYRVHVGKDGWVSPAEASAKGYFFYKDRWLPKKLQSKLKRWERLDAKVKSWKDAYRVKSKHYRIKTNAPHYVTELEIKPYLDELYRTYVSVFKNDFGLRGRAADKNHIHIYWGFQSWHVSENADRSSPGYYDPGGALKVMYDPTDVDDFYNTVFHEGAHQFFMAMLPGAALPVWLDEALAVYFEGCTFSRGRLKITANHLPVDRFASAKEDILAAQKAVKPVTPQALFMSITDPDQFDAGHYALAWSFLHYLIHRDGGKHKKDVYKFLKEMNGSGAKSVHRVYTVQGGDEEGPRRDREGVGAVHPRPGGAAAARAPGVDSQERIPRGGRQTERPARKHRWPPHRHGGRLGEVLG